VSDRRSDIDSIGADSIGTNPIEIFLPDADATASLAYALAQTQRPHAVVHLHGELGAGKSTLARAWLRALGVTGAIRSPTYTLVERYPLRDGGEALHLDLYRIGNAAELEFLGLDDADARLWLVEWPERGLAALPAADLRVELAVEGNGRRGRLVAASPAGEGWLAAAGLEGRLRTFPES
jgi:tRNA threonylcarbamoyladenosine biosynthesis protein TsaE